VSVDFGQTAKFSAEHLEGPEEILVGDHKSEDYLEGRRILWWEGDIGR
jgi:hypothetical protein